MTSILSLLLAALSAWQSTGSATNPGAPVEADPSAAPHFVRLELAARTLPSYPFVEFVNAFHEGAPVHLAIDPWLHPEIGASKADVYIVEARTSSEWLKDQSLVDVRGNPQFVLFSGASLQANTFLIDAGTLSGDAGRMLGAAYDVVVDLDRDGLLGSEDLLDGGDEAAGFYVLKATNQPGPYAVTVVLYSGGTFLDQKTYFPTDVASFEELKLVVVSHGNGHNYQWYDHIGMHLASWGYVVMSHRNNTMPGIDAASLTTITNTDYFLGNLDLIAGGVLKGKVDGHNLTWIGHSRGGEGVTYAYRRVLDGSVVPENFTAQDVRIVASMAPTTFELPTDANPHQSVYWLVYGAADNDTSGAPNPSSPRPFTLWQRASGHKQVTYIQGVGHAWFHNNAGNCFCVGPSLLDRPRTHAILLGYFLPLIQHYVEGNVPSREFFTRSYGDFHPLGVDPAALVSTEYLVKAGTERFVIDDFEQNHELVLSSSGGTVTSTVSNLFEGPLKDRDGDFVFASDRQMNGMTRAARSFEDYYGVIFDWNAPAFYELELTGELRDLSQGGYLTFRAAQGTRHPETDTLNGPVTFTVSLIDGDGTTSSIDIANYGSVTRPYPRSGEGIGAGWANEFTTFRIRLDDFALANSGLDLAKVVAVRFDFGDGFGSPRGRLGFDDIQITRD